MIYIYERWVVSLLLSGCVVRKGIATSRICFVPFVINLVNHFNFYPFFADF